MAPKTRIVLQTREGEMVPVKDEYVCCSKLFMRLMNEHNKDPTIVKCTSSRSDLERVFRWVDHHKEEFAGGGEVKMDSWDQDFINEDARAVSAIISACMSLEIDSLFSLAMNTLLEARLLRLPGEFRENTNSQRLSFVLQQSIEKCHTKIRFPL